jgi:hypothetical protein
MVPALAASRVGALHLETVNYQCITAIATVVQDFLLLVSAALIGWYLYETRRMRMAAERQVTESQALVRASDEQLEAQIRPAIAVQVRNPPESLLLVNVGKGPALNLTLSPAERGADGARRAANIERFNVPVTFIAAGVDSLSGIRTQQHPGLGGVPVLNGRSLQCQYTSLSGRTYWTVVDFDHATGNNVESTRFNVE